MRIGAGAIPLGYDRAASKRPVNMTLNEDLVRRARGITPNLSETVERLLAAFVDDAEAQAARHEQQIAAHIAASDAFVAKHGTLADEFDSL
jgi:antitoxin CcdA